MDSCRVMIIDHISVFVVVVYDFWIEERTYLLDSIHSVVPLFFLAKFVECSIGRHYHHHVVWFLHRVEMKGNPIQLSFQCISTTNLLVPKVLLDSFPRDILWPISSFLDQSMRIDSTLLKIHKRLQNTKATVKNKHFSCSMNRFCESQQSPCCLTLVIMLLPPPTEPDDPSPPSDPPAR